MGNMEHNEWFNRLTDGASGNAAGAKADISVSTLNRQLAQKRLSAETVIALCRGYGASPVEGLAATGYLTKEEATGVPADAIAEILSDQDLIRTLAYRVNADPAAWFGTFGELADEPAPDAEVFEFPNKGVEPAPYDGTVEEFDHTEPHAADSSPLEQEEREKRGEDPVD